VQKAVRWADGEPVQRPAVWRIASTGVLSLLGLGVAIYLTVDHFAKIPLVCSDSGIINCTKVTTSAESYFLGIPVAVLGLCFYAVMVVVNSPFAWRSSDRRIHLLRLALMVIGMCFALYLVACELLIIGNICLWCTSVHVITFIIFVIVVTAAPGMFGWGAAGYAYADEYQGT
jgi:uncharacterized membrane protein